VPAAIGYTVFVFIFVLKAYEEQKSKVYKFACFMRACNVVFNITERTQAEGGGVKNRVLRKIYGYNRKQVTADWRTLHDEERNDLYRSPLLRG
jgi:hypothetical protein